MKPWWRDKGMDMPDQDGYMSSDMCSKFTSMREGFSIISHETHRGTQDAWV